MVPALVDRSNWVDPHHRQLVAAENAVGNGVGGNPDRSMDGLFVLIYPKLMAQSGLLEEIASQHSAGDPDRSQD